MLKGAGGMSREAGLMAGQSSTSSSDTAAAERLFCAYRLRLKIKSDLEILRLWLCRTLK